MADIKSFFKALRLLPNFAFLAYRPVDRNAIFYHKLAPPVNGPGVFREDFLIDLCRGKRVLHFGFVDAPFAKEKISSGQLLHLQLKNVAKFIFGLDIDAASLDLYRRATGDNDNAILDILKPLPDAAFLAQQFDLILFPEVLEHVLHPGLAMENLRRICLLNDRAQLCITTPNAYSVMAFFTAAVGDELVHPDHYFYFSPVTLKKLIRDTGFQLTEMRLYAGRRLLNLPGITKHGIIALCHPMNYHPVD